MAKESKSSSQGFGIAALVLGICGLIGSWVPILNWFAIPLSILALIFGIIAVIKTTAKAIGIAGIILAGIAIVTFLLVNVILVAVVDEALNNPQVEQNLEQLLEEYDHLD